jgi:hypothetical protein
MFKADIRSGQRDEDANRFKGRWMRLLRLRQMNSEDNQGFRTVLWIHFPDSVFGHEPAYNVGDETFIYAWPIEDRPAHRIA